MARPIRALDATGGFGWAISRKGRLARAGFLD